MLELIGIRKNLAIANGAGIYVNGSIKFIENCLFKDNCSLNGLGGGIYLNENCETTINATVFDGNLTKDTSAQKGGSALFLKKSKVDIVNTVFTRDSTFSNTGTIFNDSGALKITNCTFAYNVAAQGATGITNGAGSSTEITNTILWNTNSQNELNGNGFYVNYTSITNGYTGIGNIAATDPKFINPSKPEGVDGKYGTIDDGLCLQDNSYCKKFGSITEYPETDILTFERMTNDKSDIGAYTYSTGSDGILGKYNLNGEFVPTAYFDVADTVGSYYDIIAAITNRNTHVVQVVLPKNKYTDKKSNITVQITGLDAGGSTIGAVIPVVLYRVGTTQVFRSYIFNGGNEIGKPIVFVKKLTGNNANGGEHFLAYIIRATENGVIKIMLDKGQF